MGFKMKKNNTNEEITARYEPLQKPELTEVKIIFPDTSEFSEPDKASALIKNLKLSVGSTIREDGNNSFIVNPHYVLNGTAPEQYKKEIKHFKALCTPLMIQQMSTEIKRKKGKDSKRRDRFYNSFTEKIDKRCELLKESEAKRYFSQNDINITGLHNCVYYLLDKEKKLNEFVLAWFDKPIPNIQEWKEENDGEYIVLTDSEADKRAKDYLDEDQWKQVVQSGNTTAGYEDWKENVISCDGRGSIINGYDGCEEEEEINGTTYYIYRTN